LLTAFSYRGVLARGFALVRDDAGQAVRSAATVGPGTRLSLEFADGQVAATADNDRPAVTSSGPPGSSPKPKPAPVKRAVKPADQGNLF
jgi:exodeoxyribonuclease VII large subunit